MSRAGNLPSEKSVIVAGGGLIGLSIAWRFAQKGWSVAIFDQGSLGGEASWAGAGMLAPGGELEDLSPVTALALESRRLYPEFVSELQQISKLPIDFQECGALDLAYSDQAWEFLQRRADSQTGLGIASKPVTQKQVETFWPRVSTQDLAGAIFYPGDAIVNPRELVLALAAACRQLGVSLIQNCPLLAAHVLDSRVVLETACGSRSSELLVLAAGAWSSSIKIDGVPPLPPVEPVKGHLIGYQQPEQTCNTILRSGHTYLLQRANGLLIAGSSVEKVGFNRPVDPAVASLISAQAAVILPHLAETSPSEVWTGFRPGPAGAPQIGPWHSNRLLLAYGHYRNGILLAPATAQKIVSAS